MIRHQIHEKFLYSKQFIYHSFCETYVILKEIYVLRMGTQGPVVQSIVGLTSSLVVRMLTVLVSTISNSQVFLLKNVSSFCKSYSHFFSKNISVYVISNVQSFNDT